MKVIDNQLVANSNTILIYAYNVSYGINLEIFENSENTMLIASRRAASLVPKIYTKLTGLNRLPY